MGAVNEPESTYVFTERIYSNHEMLSCLAYDSSGDYLAIGRKDGYINVFKKGSTYGYESYTDFMSHESEFDYLKSVEIEERINKVRFLGQKYRDSPYMLSTNDKTIKLWRLRKKVYKSYPQLIGRNSESSLDAEGDLFRSSRHPVVQPEVKQVFANAHAYHINSVSMNSDQETFLSSDDLRINLWNLVITSQSFQIVDLKPVNMEDLAEVITSAQFHPTECSTFIYSSSRGVVRLCDMRTNALCDKHSLLLEDPKLLRDGGFFCEIIGSISDAVFSPNGRYVATRDFLSVKVWDLHMPKEPVHTIPVHEHYRNKLCTLYEKNCIFDKFELAWSHDNRYITTGSYDHMVRIYDLNCIEDQLKNFQPASTEAEGEQSSIPMYYLKSVSPFTSNSAKGRVRRVDPHYHARYENSACHADDRILHVASHPKQLQNVVLIGPSANALHYQMHYDEWLNGCDDHRKGSLSGFDLQKDIDTERYDGDISPMDIDT